MTGAKVRELLKIPAGAQKFAFKQVPDFDVYVQSTSHNRVLMPNTKFLYEVNSSAAAKGDKSHVFCSSETVFACFLILKN